MPPAVRRVVLAAVVPLSAVAAPPAFADPPTFAPAVSAGTTAAPRSVAIGDLDRDGRNELAVASSSTSAVSVFFRNGPNTTWDPPIRAGTTGAEPAAVAVGDLDGDGVDDLATADSGPDQVTVVTRNATNTGWNAPEVAGRTTADPFAIAIGDLNGDGRNDLATADFRDSAVTIITRNATNTGWSSPTSVATGTGPEGVAIADLDADGRNDLVTADAVAGTVSVILRNATNSGWTAASSAGSAASPRSVAAGDLDGDGRLDLATADFLGSTITVIARNATNTGWRPPETAGTTGSGPRSVAIGDLDGDGRPDLASADSGSDQVTVITRRATGDGWDAPIAGATGDEPRSVALGDLDGDGRPDLATADLTGARASVLRNTTSRSAPPVAILERPSDPTAERRPSVAFSSSDAYARFECRLDDGPFAPCSSPYRTTSDLADGPHAIAVRARSPFAPGLSSSAVVDFTIATASAPAPPPTSTTIVVREVAPPPPQPAARPAPTAAIRRPRATRRPFTLRGTATAGTTRVRVSVSRAVRARCRFLRTDRRFTAPRSCRTPIRLTARGTRSWTLRVPRLAPGRYTFSARAVDAQGRVESRATARNTVRLTVR